MRFWLEKTIVHGRADRNEGPHRLGKALWSPQASSDGKDIYASMREIQPGDFVFHLVDNVAIEGVSVAEKSVETKFFGKEFTGVDDTDWSSRPCYRIPLSNYTPLVHPIDRKDIFATKNKNWLLELIENNRGLFFNKKLELRQGAYLTEVPVELAHLLNQIYSRNEGESLPMFPQLKNQPGPDEDKTDMLKMSSDFYRNLKAAHFLVPVGIIESIYGALQAKPFLILTGLSGSGKTQLAQAISKWICGMKSQIALVAVGADWTSNENLLGYPDALKEKSYRKPDNGALDLILLAMEDPQNPYFLILDEMNLSHVERYFSDILSAMESGEGVSLHDGSENEVWDKVPGMLTIPRNLFVIGTVNVDETTYMFSPKVLDRANVIEFRVSDEEMNTFLGNPLKPDLDAIAGQGTPYARSFVASAQERNVELDAKTREQVSSMLMSIFPLLKEVGAEFGYRTAHEVCRFIYFHKELSGEGWKFEVAIDAAIMQKLLPKLHGSKKKLGPVLTRLLRLCLKEAVRPGDEKSPIGEDLIKEENALYWKSIEKLGRMQKRLAEHGFTSFAEA